jgi:hypothetical protein
VLRLQRSQVLKGWFGIELLNGDMKEDDSNNEKALHKLLLVEYREEFIGLGML